MNDFSNPQTRIFTPVIRFLRLSLCLLFLGAFLLIGGCKKDVDYFSYVSELRSNVLLCKTDEFSLRIYAVTKENPYATDGVPRDKTVRTEIYLLSDDTTQEYYIYFTVNGKEYGGDMSFDNVKAEYYYSCSLDASTLNELTCRIEYGEKKTELIANSVRTDDTLSPRQALAQLRSVENALFQSMTDKYGFTGELHVRLIYEDNPYYYLGVIDRNGKTTAYLMNAKTGKLLAKREQ